MSKNFKTDIKKIYDDLKRNLFLKKLNNLSSDIHIESDRVFLYIDKYHFERSFNDQDEYYISLYNIENIKNEEYNQNIYKYKLNKPFIYIFDGIIFDKKIILTLKENATVIFKNCTFKEGIEITKCSNLIFTNNKYYCHGTYTKERKPSFITGKGIDTIKFKNETFYNNDISHHPTPHFGINLIAANIEFSNSIVNTDSSIKIEDKIYRLDKQSEIILQSKNIIINNTKFNSPNIYIESDNISINESNIKATNGIAIVNKDDNIDFEQFDTPYLLYNKEEIIKKANTKPLAIIKKINYKNII